MAGHLVDPVLNRPALDPRATDYSSTTSFGRHRIAPRPLRGRRWKLWLRKQISLTKVRPGIEHSAELIGRFDAFGYDHRSQFHAEPDDVFDEYLLARIGVQTAHHGAVQLHHLGLEIQHPHQV